MLALAVVLVVVVAAASLDGAVVVVDDVAAVSDVDASIDDAIANECPRETRNENI